MPRDILILGAGPSGLSTTLHLVQRAPHLSSRILILEKAHHPRHKLCGGGLTPDAEVVLQSLGLDVTEIPHVDASEAHLEFAGRGLVIAFRKRHALRIIRRDEFDAWLASKVRLAGIQIREGVTARRIIPREDSVQIETDAGTFEASILIGADGSNGITRRTILPHAPIHTARALEVIIPAPLDAAAKPNAAHTPGALMFSENGYADGVFASAYPFSESDSPPPALGEGQGVGADDDSMRWRGMSAALHRPSQGWGQSAPPHAATVAYFDFAPVPLGIAGYTWDFPTQVNGQPMRCWGIYDTNLLADGARPQLKQPLADEMQRRGADLDAVEIQGHPIRWFTPRSELSVPRVILVGDAAGADGVFGEGISIALGYGRIAADAILDALARGDFSFGDYRRRVLLSPLGQALTVRTAITHILYRLHWAWFQAFFWRVFKPIVAVVSLLIVLNWSKRK